MLLPLHRPLAILLPTIFRMKEEGLLWTVVITFMAALT
jgi:hypothetical protein